MSRHLGYLLFTSIALLTTLPAASAADALDWNYWRGPEFNGISRETGLPDDWDPRRGTNVSWKRDDLGTRSTPIVMNGRLYVMARAEPETATEGERIVCLDAVTGKTIWENRFNVWLSDVPDTRVGWSSVVGDPETGNVYMLGVCGYFQCLNGETGERLWGFPLHEKFGLLSTYGGRTNFPIVFEDLVVISSIVIGWGEMAKPAHRFLAFDKRTGEVAWFKGTRLLPFDTTYSAPNLTVFKGRRALVFGSGDGAVWALAPRTGEPIWQYRFSRRGLNVSPLVVGDLVFTGHSEENISGNAMGAVVAIDGSGQGDLTSGGALWRKDELMMGKCAPLAIGDRLYCFDDRAKLHVLDIKTGKAVMRRPYSVGGTTMRASPLYADGKIYAFGTSGWSILRPDPKRGVKVVKRKRLPAGEEVYASPICSHGKIYVATTSALYCLQDKTKEPGVVPRPEIAQESPLKDEKPAPLQVSPAELLLKPGDTQKFTVRLFNGQGQFLKETAAEFKITGPGEMTSDGVFTAAGGEGHYATAVEATASGLSGTARIRVVPPLPWNFDFEGLKFPPLTWVGARYRHVIREVDGSNAMVKISTIPKGARSRCWFGHPELSNYTIQADIKGALSKNKMPDIGLIAQGYTMDLKGESKSLQIRSWVPQLRMAKTIPFPWKPGQWYTMKLKATVEKLDSGGQRAHLYGKVWPRDEDEPAAWTIEAFDASPNLSGSPGLFGNAKDAELFLDNIKVTANN